MDWTAIICALCGPCGWVLVLSTHQAGLGICDQSGAFVAQSTGEDGEVCISQLLEIGSAVCLWHQRVAAREEEG